MRARRRVTIVAILAAASVASSAVADTAPSRWDRARDPRVGDDWDLHVKVSDWLNAPEVGLNPRLLQARLLEAEDWLEEAHAETSQDVRLRFDLGEVYEQLQHHERAVQVLAPALAAAPDHPASAEAFIEIAYAYAYLDRSREELAAYDAYLTRTTNVSGRATALLNRAEAEMRLGHLDDAVLGYRDAIAVSESISGLRSLFNNDVLARWGLAVALDRSGDASGGAREAAVAAQLDPGTRSSWPRGSIIGNDQDGVKVFFVPDYERFYYLALGMTDHAKQAARPREAVDLWHKTEMLWSSYVAGAELWDQKHKDRPDRWLPFARAHLAKAQKERALASTRKP